MRALMKLSRWREEGVRGINGDERRLDLGCEHTTHCAFSMMWNCAPETCAILLTSINPINSVKRKK